jgi:hypothetical protein
MPTRFGCEARDCERERPTAKKAGTATMTFRLEVTFELAAAARQIGQGECLPA